MAQATGAQGVPLISIVGGAVYYSLDQGATWTEAQQPGSPSNSAAPVSGDGTAGTPFTIAAGAIALTKLAHQADQTVAGNVAGSSASPVALTATQLTALVNPATASLPGAMTAAQAAQLQGGMVPFSLAYTSVIDFTATGITTIIQPCPARYTTTTTLFIEFKAITGVTGNPTFQIGSDAGMTNLVASAAYNMAGLTIETRNSIAAASPVPCLDLTANGLRISITAAAVATALTGRVWVIGSLLPV